MNYIEEQQKVIDALKPYTNALAEAAAKFPGVGVSGFVFAPDIDLAMHFSNIAFIEPKEIVFLHTYLARLTCALMNSGQMTVVPQDEKSPLNGKPGPIPSQELGDRLKNAKTLDFCLTLADLLAKMILMCPTDAVPTEIAEAASRYTQSRTKEARA